MKLFKELLLLKNHLDQQKPSSLGLVPTMGALHDGHLALIKRAVNENEYVIISIFVNPTQFDNKNDLKAYPKSLSNDLQKLASFEEKFFVYAPEVDDLYPNAVKSEVYEFDGLDKTMEGKSRKDHFKGVATLVHKLFEGFMPTRAYFGEKDYQQLSIIHALVEQKNLPIQIVNCPIVREEDGLAMSSRNTRLTKEHRTLAPKIYNTLLQAKAQKQNHTVEEIYQWVNNYFKTQPEFELDYFCVADATSLQPISGKVSNQKARAFIAVKLGEIRLIDNVNF